jgi:hypothetical protein
VRNIGGVVVIDFIDMAGKLDRLTLLNHFEKLLEMDPAHPQIGRLSDLGLVELTRHRQEKTLLEAFGSPCDKCGGAGWHFPIFEGYSEKPQAAEERRVEPPPVEQAVKQEEEEARETKEYRYTSNSDLEEALLSGGGKASGEEEETYAHAPLPQSSAQEFPASRDHPPQTIATASEGSEEPTVTQQATFSAQKEKAHTEKIGEKESVRLPVLTLENNTQEVLPGIFRFNE